MPSATPREVVKAVRADYLDLLSDGTYRWSVEEIAQRHGLSINTVCRLMTKRGLSRYCTSAGPAFA